MDTQANRGFDSEEWTAKFGELVIDFAKQVPTGPIANRLIDQLAGAGTSAGANSCKADDAVFEKDFLHRHRFCKKVAPEARHFVRMIARVAAELRKSAKPIRQRAKESLRLVATTYRSR